MGKQMISTLTKAGPVKIQTETVTSHDIFDTHHTFLFSFFFSQESDEGEEDDDIDSDDYNGTSSDDDSDTTVF